MLFRSNPVSQSRYGSATDCFGLLVNVPTTPFSRFTLTLNGSGTVPFLLLLRSMINRVCLLDCLKVLRMVILLLLQVFLVLMSLIKLLFLPFKVLPVLFLKLIMVIGVYLVLILFL